jgi:hypothetical protein
MARNLTNADFNPEGKDQKALDTYILAKYDSYENRYNVPLWAIFKQDFKKWSLENFEQASFLHLDSLIVRLRTNGVCVDTSNPGQIPETIYTVSQESNIRPWTEADVRYHLDTGESF